MMKSKNKSKLGWYIFGGVLVAIIIGVIVALIVINTQKSCPDEEENNTTVDPRLRPVDKPIIYLYPESPINVSVKLGNASDLLISYPQYDDGWDVFAKPDGTLTDNKTGRELYSLYWEGKNGGFKVANEGFIVSSDNATSFLEEKLALLGLSARESEEFIVYWLPEMNKNPYNYVRFATREEIDSYMPLQISPIPDNVIRVMMVIKGLDEPIEIKEQTLDSTPTRDGFTVVEWGGTVAE